MQLCTPTPIVDIIFFTGQSQRVPTKPILMGNRTCVCIARHEYLFHIKRKRNTYAARRDESNKNIIEWQLLHFDSTIHSLISFTRSVKWTQSNARTKIIAYIEKQLREENNTSNRNVWTDLWVMWTSDVQPIVNTGVRSAQCESRTNLLCSCNKSIES